MYTFFLFTVYTLFCLFIFHFLLYLYSTQFAIYLNIPHFPIASQYASEGRHTLVVGQSVFKFVFYLIFFIKKREIMAQNKNFMSLHGFAFVISG